MSATVVNIILWGVFLIVLLVSGGVFCVSGYKKGVWHALISLGTTLVAFALSLLLANVIAPVLTPAVSGLLRSEEAVSSSLKDLLLAVATDGVVESALSLLLFVVFLLLLTVVLKIVGSKLQKNRFFTPEKGLRYAGLGVRVADALVFTALLILPLYGTLSVYASAAQSVLDFGAFTTSIASQTPSPSGDTSVTEDAATDMALYQPVSAARMSIKTVSEDVEMIDSEQSAYMEMLAGVNAHPLVTVANVPPMQAVYSGLSAFETSDGNVEIIEIVSAADELLFRLENLIGKDVADYGKEEQEFIDFLRDEVMQTEWFYALYSECLVQAQDMLAYTQADTAFTEELFMTLQLSKEEFDATCVPLLDFADYLLSSRLINEMIRPNVDAEILYEKGLFNEIAKLLNSNEQMAALKALLLQDIVEFLFEQDPVIVQTLKDRITCAPLTDAAQLEAEAEAIVAALQNAASWQRIGGTNKATLVMHIKGVSIIESLARHPMFGLDAIKEIMQKTDFEQYLGVSSKYMSGNFEQAALDSLQKSIDAPVGEKPFVQFVEQYFNVIHA